MTNNIKVDAVDSKILSLLSNNARIQWREIGEEVHMTGQAVGERIKRLTHAGIIKGYHTIIDESLYTKKNVDFITIILTSGNHLAFLKKTNRMPEIKEVYRTSGAGCYLIKVETESKETLDQLLLELIPYGNYQINSVISKVK